MAVTLSMQNNMGPVTWENANIVVLPQPKAGQTSSISSTVWNTGTDAATNVTVSAYYPPGNIFSSGTTFGDVLAWPVAPGASTTLASASVPPNNGSANALNQWAVPTDISNDHRCVWIVVSCPADPLAINASTPLDVAINDRHCGFHNFTIMQLSVADVPKSAAQVVQVPVLADPAATRTAGIEVRQVPLREHYAEGTAGLRQSAGAVPQESSSQFAVSAAPAGLRTATAGTEPETFHLNIEVPPDVVAGTEACFEIVAVENGKAVNGYRVLLQFV
jgi:uncharacterized repeat protein (TIGR01451 family)